MTATIAAMTGTQYRAATVDAVDVTTRELLVRAAPYELEADIGGGILETFARGAFSAAAEDPQRLTVWHNHSDAGGQLVGRAVGVEDRDDGVYVRARIGSTAAARDMMTLVEEKILTDVSVEFQAARNGMVVRDLGGGRIAVRHKRARLLGFALVGEGAFGREAYVESFRSADADMAAEAERAWLELYRQSDPFKR